MLSRFHLIPERHGQTDRIVISISRVSVLTRDKNWRIKPSPKLLCVSGVVVSQRASDKAEWRFIPATLCRWRSCFLADQLGFMTRIRERKKERKRASRLTAVFSSIVFDLDIVFTAITVTFLAVVDFTVNNKHIPSVRHIIFRKLLHNFIHEHLIKYWSSTVNLIAVTTVLGLLTSTLHRC